MQNLEERRIGMSVLTRRHTEPEGTVLRGLEHRALRGDGVAHVDVVVSVPHEASVLLVLPRLFRVGHSEIVVLPHEPVAQTRELTR